MTGATAGCHVPACEVCPDVQASLSRIVDSAPAKTPAHRPSAAEMRDSLRELQVQLAGAEDL